MNIGSWLGLLALQIFVAALADSGSGFVDGHGDAARAGVGERGGRRPLLFGWSGAVMRVNTLGAIAGAFWHGFILIPKASTRFTILFAATLCVIVAGFAYQPARDS